MFCIFCGKEIFDSAVFCKYCGRRVAGNGSQGVPQPIGGMRPGVPADTVEPDLSFTAAPEEPAPVTAADPVPVPISAAEPAPVTAADPVPVPISAAEPAPVLMPAAEVIPSPAPEPIPMPVPEPTPVQNSEKTATNKSAPGICPACGAALHPGAPFCGVCGTKL